MRALFNAGVYPPDLILLEETSITLTELDSMDPERKKEYFLFVMERKKRQKEEMEKLKSGSDRPNARYFSEDDFIG